MFIIDAAVRVAKRMSGIVSFVLVVASTPHLVREKNMGFLKCFVKITSSGLFEFSISIVFSVSDAFGAREE